MNRRSFVKNTTFSCCYDQYPSVGQFICRSESKKLGFIGVGLRGQNHLDNALRRTDVEVVAICDVDDHMLKMAGDVVKKSGKPMPKVFTGDPYACKKLLELKEIDGVVIATPWEWHAPMAIGALEAGKYVGTEVMLGITLEDHWNVVKACERTNGNLMMLGKCFVIAAMLLQY